MKKKVAPFACDLRYRMSPHQVDEESVGFRPLYPTYVPVQPDGKIVTAGFAYFGASISKFSVVRFNSDGTLDTNFGTGGKVTTAIGATEDLADGMALQSDGKIVTAGYTKNGTKKNFAMARYNANGSMDTTFGSGGIVTTATGTGNNAATAVALRGTSKIVAAGYSYNGTDNDVAIAQFLQ